MRYARLREKNISLFESVLPADAHAHKTRFFRAEKLVAQRRAMQSASYGDSVLLAQNIAYFVAGAVSDSETDYAAGIFQAHDMYVGDFLQAFFYGVCDKLYLRMIVFSVFGVPFYRLAQREYGGRVERARFKTVGLSFGWRSRLLCEPVPPKIMGLGLLSSLKQRQPQP